MEMSITTTTMLAQEISMTRSRRRRVGSGTPRTYEFEFARI